MRIPEEEAYKYLGVHLHRNTNWTKHVEEVITKGKAAVAKHMRFLASQHLDRAVRLLVYKQYVRPVLEYGAEVWTATASQSRQLEAIQLSAARAILGCFHGTASVAVRAELGLEPLSERRTLAQLRWYGKLCVMPQHRYPVRVLSQHSGARSWKGRLEKDWQHTVGGQAGAGDLPSFFSTHGPSAFGVAARLFRSACQQRHEHDLNRYSTLTHLPLIPTYHNKLQPYLRGVHDPGVLLKMKCRTGSIQINHLLHKRHLTDSPTCPCCDAVETLEHFFLHCPAYMDRRARLRADLEELAGSYVPSLYSLDDTSIVCGLLSDRPWFLSGCFTQANRHICSFLADAWACRESIVTFDW